MKDYAAVILVGSLFFKLYGREQDLQPLTWVDSLFFCTVVSSTVGYGHIIAPQSFGAKFFCIFYFFVSTVVVGGLIGSLSSLYFDKLERGIQDKIIDSTIWVHKADLGGDGTIFQADYRESLLICEKRRILMYCTVGPALFLLWTTLAFSVRLVMFKLQQMKAVDSDILNRLCDRFQQLDVNQRGLLHVGAEVGTGDWGERLCPWVGGPKGRLMSLAMDSFCIVCARFPLQSRLPNSKRRLRASPARVS